MHRGFWIRIGVLALVAGLIGGVGIVAGTYVRTAGGGKIAGHAVPFVRPAFEGKSRINVLVLGLDVKDKLNPKLGQRSDSILMLNVDLEKKSVKGLSIPRDSLVEIAGRHPYKDKINAAYQVGGIDNTLDTLEHLTSVRPEYYVVSEPEGFEQLVTLIGGIDMDVEKNMDYDDNWQNLHIHLKKGFQHMNGEQAMGYVRFRHDRFADITRMERQQKFLRAVAQRMMALSNLPKLPKIMAGMHDAVNTNIETPDLLYLATTLRHATGDNIKMATYPGVPQMLHGISYLIPDEKKGKEMVADTFDIDMPGAASVEVLNASGQKGAARKVAGKLEEMGYRIVRVANSEEETAPITRILYRTEKMQSVSEIATLLGTADIRQESEKSDALTVPPIPDGKASGKSDTRESRKPDEKSDVTVIVGSDFTDALLH